MVKKRPSAPPPPGNDKAFTTGNNKTLIEAYNIAPLIRDKRMKGESYRLITKEINDSGVIPGGYKISHNTIARWCRSNGLGGDIEVPTENKMVNVYGTKVQALNLVTSAIDIITVALDELNKKLGDGTCDIKELKQTIDMLDRMTLRQQTLSTDIGEIQEKVYTYSTVARAMNIINDILKVRLNEDDYNAVMDAFRDNPALIEALRKIAPPNV